jgi:hypothetical protein
MDPGAFDYIKNSGETTTYIHHKNRKTMRNKMKWKANYDGENAHIQLDINSDGNKSKIQTSLTRDDLTRMLNIQPVNIPLEKRLIDDYKPTVHLKKCGPTKFVQPDLVDYKFIDDNMNDLSQYKLKENPYITPQQFKRSKVVERNTRKNKHIPRQYKKSSSVKRPFKPRHASNRNLFHTPSPNKVRIHLSPNSGSMKYGGKRRKTRGKYTRGKYTRGKYTRRKYTRRKYTHNR